ncbi:MAG: hypothetical protein IPO09_10220 [Anaeromyxobacter sp.]|nr:hypothetical protein [Anaeromyxobacter sp.]MBL0278517.1 hypothetical protein [Anaeromyxobacter sp.]
MARRTTLGRAGAAVLALLAAASLAAPGRARADAYDDAMAAAAAAGAEGRHEAAAALLAGPAATWPQDFPLQLARAYHLLRAGRYPAAAEAYRAALRLAPSSEEARRGLDDARALRGARSQAWLGVYGAGSSADGHPSRGSLAVAALSLDAVVADHLAVGGLYRALVPPSASSGRGRGASAGTVGAPVQHEGHLSLGYAAPAWGVTLHGAAISGSTAQVDGATELYGYQGAGAGLSLWAVAGLEWRAAGAVTWYEDLPVAQLEGSAALPLWRHLALRGGWRGQWLDGAQVGAALLGLEWRGPLSLALSGELGTQRRPWDLAGRALFDLPDDLEWAARLQLGFPMGGLVRGWLGADLEGWRTPVAGAAPVDSTTVRLAAGLVFSF